MMNTSDENQLNTETARVAAHSKSSPMNETFAAMREDLEFLRPKQVAELLGIE
jgi:hypothetical protein